MDEKEMKEKQRIAQLSRKLVRKLQDIRFELDEMGLEAQKVRDFLNKENA